MILLPPHAGYYTFRNKLSLPSGSFLYLNHPDKIYIVEREGRCKRAEGEITEKARRKWSEWSHKRRNERTTQFRRSGLFNVSAREAR